MQSTFLLLYETKLEKRNILFFASIIGTLPYNVINNNDNNKNSKNTYQLIIFLIENTALFFWILH